MPTEVRPRLLTSGEAAHLIGVTIETMVRASDEGRVTTYILPGSRHRRYEPADVLALKRAMMLTRRPPDKLAAAQARAAYARACKAARRQPR